MCGIAGFWGAPDRALLEAMTLSLRHRGPDDDGHFEDAHASLGFRRLSIIDLEHGSQPMSMDGGRLQIVYNGEVYNFRELRAELEALGHTFQTTCDTEVVLHAYAEWGTDCFRRFNGMWGLAILDERAPAARLVLARDHFGIKPLFYARHRGRVVFASEIKAILQDETFPREVDEQQMYEYLRFGLFDHNDGTFFRGIRQVPAAAFAVIEGGADLRDRVLDSAPLRGRRRESGGVSRGVRARGAAPARRRCPGRHLPERRPRFLVDLHRDGAATPRPCPRHGVAR